MRKSLNLFLAFVIAFFTFPFTGQKAASASAKDNSTVVPDEAYEINYVINEDGKDKESIADQYFVKPGTLLVIDNEKYAQLTISNGDMVRELSTDNGEVVIVQENDDNSIVVQFKVESVEMDLDMRVVVPEIPGVFPGYDTRHTTQLVFDGNSKKKIDVDSHKLVTSEGKNGPTVDPESPEEPETEEPEKPEEDPKDESLIELDNGSYTMDVSYLRSDNDNPSSMGRYMDEKAFVTVKDGKAEITITVKEHKTVTKLLVDGDKSTVAKLDGDKRYETFVFDSLQSIKDAYVEYQAPFGDSIHYGKADFRIVFDEENIAESSAVEQPGYNIEETLFNLEDGFYTIDTSYIKVDDGTESAMGRHLGDTVFVSFQEGKVLVTITVNDDETVTKLQVNGKNAIEKVVDGQMRYETFEFDDLLSLMNAYVEYQAPTPNGVHNGQADFIIALDQQSIKLANASDKPGANVEEPQQPEDPSEDPKKEQDEEKQESEEVDLITPDKAYEIDYVIMHEDGTKESVANQYFTNLGLLLEKDGKTYVQLTITDGDMVRELSNKYGDALLIKKNDDGSIVVQFRVNDDLSDMLLEMRIVVPAMPGFPGYDMEHKALLVFDKASKKEIPVDDHTLAGTNNPKNENGPFVEGDDIPKKPELGPGENGETPENGKTDNPKTGDPSQIVLYALLLIGSLIPLGIQLKRRFA